MKMEFDSSEKFKGVSGCFLRKDNVLVVGWEWEEGWLELWNVEGKTLPRDIKYSCNEVFLS